MKSQIYYIFTLDHCIVCSLHLRLSLHFSGYLSRWTWASRYQNVSIVDCIGAKVDGSGGNNWSYKACKAPVKSSPPINQHRPYPIFLLQVGCPSCYPTNSVQAPKGKLKLTPTTDQRISNECVVSNNQQAYLCWLLSSSLTLELELCVLVHAV